MCLTFVAYLECGNHGECDHRTGKCECEHGFHGVSCSKTDDNNVRLFLYSLRSHHIVVIFGFRMSTLLRTMGPFSLELC